MDVIHHDPMCPACGDADCTCDCFCAFIADVRDDERRILSPYLRSVTEIAAENRP